MKVAALLLLGAAVAGCAHKPKSEAEQRVETVKREQAPERLYEAGRAFASIGDLTRAEQYLTAALEQGYDERKVVPVLISVLIEGKRYRLAIEQGEAYLKKHGGDHRLRLLVSTLYMALGEHDNARKSLEELLRRSPDDPEGNYAMGVLYRDALRDVVRADVHFRAYLRLAPGGSHADDARASLLRSVP